MGLEAGWLEAIALLTCFEGALEVLVFTFPINIIKTPPANYASEHF